MGLIANGSIHATFPGVMIGLLRNIDIPSQRHGAKRTFHASVGFPVSTMAAAILPDEATALCVEAVAEPSQGQPRAIVGEVRRVTGEGLASSSALRIRLARALLSGGSAIATGEVRYARTGLSLRVRGQIAAPPTPEDVANAVMDGALIEPGMTMRQAMRLISAVLAGKVSGASGTTLTFKSAVADHKTRLTVTTDSDGNRLTITPDTSN